MKRMRFILGLSTVLLMVIALALPAAVLAQESAAITEAEMSVGETSVETALTETETGSGEEELENPAPENPAPENPAPENPEPENPAPENPVTAIEGLISTVEGLNLRQGIENSLDVKLQNARDSLTAANAGLREDAISKLQAFINACEAQRDKALTSDQANMLIEMSNAIIASL